MADGKQHAHHWATDEFCENVYHGDRSEQSGVVRAIYEGSSEALKRRLFAFTHAAYEEG